MRHAVGLQPHDELEPVARDLDVEGGVVLSRKGVVLAAIARDLPRIGVAGRGLGAAEHHVLEEMGEAGMARRIVHPADLVPDHLGDDGRAMIGDHHDLHTVGQRELGDGLGGGSGGGRKTEKSESSE